MKVDVVSPLDLSGEEMEVWSGLQAADHSLASPFLSPQWVQALARVDGPDRRHGRVAIMREGGEPVGFLPARVCRSTALPIGAPACDYQAVVARPELAFNPRDIVRAFGVSRLDFHHLPKHQTAFAPFARGGADSHVIDLTGGYDAYAAGRRAAGSDILQDCAKKRRKLAREHGEVRFTALSPQRGDLERLIDWKRAQYRATGQTDIFAAGWPLELLRQLFDTREARFGGALFTLHVGDRLAAAHLALRSKDVLHAWFIAHDEALSRCSPGVVLIADILQWAAENDYRELDLGPGDYRFKLSLANVQRRLTHGFVGRPSPAALVREAAYGLRGAAERLPLGRVSQLPGKAMRRLDLWRALG